ncbi:MAG: AAA family ATPase [Mariprofundales bacterium]
MGFSKSVRTLVYAAKYIAITKHRDTLTVEDLANAARALDTCRAMLASILEVDAAKLPLEKFTLAEDWEMSPPKEKVKIAADVRQLLSNADQGKNLETLLTALILQPESKLAPLDDPHFKHRVEEMMDKHDLNADDARLAALQWLASHDQFDHSCSMKREEVAPEGIPPKPAQQKAQEPESKQASAMRALLKNVAHIKTELEDVVVGQPDAIEAMCDGLSKQIYRVNRDAPAAIFLFVGPSASGKTLLANALADTMGGDWKNISVQMETMIHHNDGFDLNGLTSGYSEARPGKITNFVRENPRSVVVFENFDKAHANVRAILEPLFTTGVLVDQHGFFKQNSDGDYDYTEKIAEPEVSFRDAIVIFTTNAGEEVYSSPAFGKLIKEQPDQMESMLRYALGRVKHASQEAGESNSIAPAFLDGLATGSTILFKTLALDSLVHCARRSIDRSLLSFKEGLGVDVCCEKIDLIAKALILSFSPDVNALTAGNDLAERLLDPIMDFMRDQQGKLPEDVRIAFARDQQQQLNKVLASFEGRDPVEAMFRKNQTLHVTIGAAMHRGKLLVRLGDIALQRVPHAHDFCGSGALRAEIPDVSFENIAGHHSVKKRMREIVKILKNPVDIQKLGVNVPKGLLLWGPPGTGKTMLAKALAHEADLPFISTTGSELLDIDFIKTTFQRARKYAPSILFIDEIDAIGSRGHSTGLDVIINQLLIEIDGFDTSLSAPVFIVAATNLPDKIDNALVRSGRIDLKVKVPMLDRDARTHFIEQYFKLPHDGSLNRDELLNCTTGMSGADLEMVRRESVLEMVSAGRSKITMEMLTEQINTIKYGIRSVNPRLLQSLDATAYHEAGHAIVSMVVNPDVHIEQVTVMPREDALGFVSYDIESAQYRQLNRQEVLDHMCVALAGRIAQSRQFPDHGDDSGASSDLRKATWYAILAITKLGFDEKIGNVVLLAEEFPPLIEKTMLLERVQAWVKAAETLCTKIIGQHWNQIDQLAQCLIKEEVVTGDQLRAEYVITEEVDA